MTEVTLGIVLLMKVLKNTKVTDYDPGDVQLQRRAGTSFLVNQVDGTKVIDIQDYIRCLLTIAPTLVSLFGKK